MTTKNAPRKIRRRGEGSVYQVGNRWVGKLQDGKKADGKPNRLTFTGKTEAEVRRQIRQYHKDKKKYSPANIASISFKEYTDRWLYSRRIYQLKETSFDRLESTIRTHIYPELGHLQLENVTSEDIQSLINNLFRNELSHSSIKKVYDACNAIFKHANNVKDLNSNPMHGVEMISSKRFPKKQTRYFTKEEVKLIEEESTRRYRTGNLVYKHGYAFILMLNTGIRESEVLGINKKRDIDLEENTLTIYNSVITVKERDKNDPSTVIGYTTKVQDTVKTDAGSRIIPLNKRAREAIDVLLSISHEECELLISNREGKTVTPATLNKSFKRIMEASETDQEGSGTHTLRHTFASNLFENGVDAKVVSELLGHANVSITYNTYIHLIQKQKVKAIDSLDF